MSSLSSTTNYETDDTSSCGSVPKQDCTSVKESTEAISNTLFPGLHLFHAYKEISVQWIGSAYEDAYTFVLHRCRCGSKYVQTLRGHWPIEDVRGA